MKYFRSSIDLGMSGLLLFLLSYPETRGLYRHGVCGCILLLLFIWHHLLNLHWYSALAKGSWNAARLFSTAVDIALYLATLATLLSCLLLSGEVFALAPFAMTGWARSLHTTATAWLYVLVCIHAGLHWPWPWNVCSAIVGKAWPYLAGTIICIGLWCALTSGIWDNLFLSELNPGRPESLEQFLYYYGATAAGGYMGGRSVLVYLRQKSRVQPANKLSQ